MSHYPVKILMDRTVAYYNHIPLIWELLRTDPFTRARNFLEYFKVWADMVNSKVPITKREYARKCLDVTRINTYRQWASRAQSMTRSKTDEEPPSQQMLSDLKEGYQMDRVFFGYMRDTDFSDFEWDTGFKERIDGFLGRVAEDADAQVNEPNFDDLHAHLKNPGCLLRVIARYMRVIKGRKAIEDQWNQIETGPLVKYRPSPSEARSVNILIVWGEQADVFQSIPLFYQNMHKYFSNPARQIGPLVYGWYTQDSLKKALLVKYSGIKPGNIYDVLRFRKGYRWATEEMKSWFGDMNSALHQLVLSMEKGASEAILAQIAQEGESIQTGPTTGRSGS